MAQECKVEAGQLLGVGKIVNGSVGIVGKTYYLILQLIDVRTGEILRSVEDECRCEIDELLGSTRKLAKKLLSEQIVPPPAIATKPTPIVESETEDIETKAKAEAEAIAKAKEIERIKAEEISKPAEPEQKITNSIGMTFVYIKPGTFMMGSPTGEHGRGKDETQH